MALSLNSCAEMAFGNITLGKSTKGKRGDKGKKKSLKDPAELVAEHAEEYKEKMKEKLSVKKKKAEQLKKKLETLEKNTTNLEEEYKGLVAKNRSEIAAEYRKAITKLKKSYHVQRFEVDDESRIIITTEMLKVKMASKEKEIGVFQIRVDFSASGPESGIQILNITRRHEGGYDNPTIKETKPCWGNLANDLSKEFEERNLYEIVIDLIDYIQSPNVNHGYITNWKEFFKKAEKMPKDFNFEKYDQQKEEGRSEGLFVLSNGIAPITTANDTTTEITIDPYMAMQQQQQVAQAEAERRRQMQGFFSHQYDAPAGSVSVYPAENAQALLASRIAHQIMASFSQFFKPDAARLYANLIAQKIVELADVDSPSEVGIIDIDFRRHDSDGPIEVYFQLSGSGPMTTQNEGSAYDEQIINQTRPERIFIDASMLKNGVELNGQSRVRITI